MNYLGAPTILHGAYGPKLRHVSKQLSLPELAHPQAFLSHRVAGLRHKIEGLITAEYIQSDPRPIQLVTNTYGVHHTGHYNIHDPHQQVELYTGAYKAALAAVLSAAQQSGRYEDKPQIFGSAGPWYDAYAPKDTIAREQHLDPKEMRDFHEVQAAAIKAAHIDVMLCETIRPKEEALGAALAAKKQGKPCIISFIIDANGKLPNGESLVDAIRYVEAGSNNYPLGYSINCCPPEGLALALQELSQSTTKSGGPLTNRIYAIYPNAVQSNVSQQELDAAREEGRIIGVDNPKEVALYLYSLAKRYRIKMIGGCCGFTAEDLAIMAEVRDTHGAIGSIIN